MRIKGKTHWRRRRDRILRDRMVLSGRILDVGCGWRLPPWDALRIDINPAFRPDVVGDVEGHLCLRDESFDAVVCLDVLEHVRRPGAAVAEIRRVLKSGGRLYLTSPYCYPRHGVEYCRFSELGLRDLLEGFEAEIVPVVQRRIWDSIRNRYPGAAFVEGYVVMARKKSPASGAD